MKETRLKWWIDREAGAGFSLAMKKAGSMDAISPGLPISNLHGHAAEDRPGQYCCFTHAIYSLENPVVATYLHLGDATDKDIKCINGL